MKSLIVLTSVFFGVAGCYANRTFADYVVATNLTDSQERSTVWTPFGLISATQNNNRLGQTFVPLLGGFLTTVDALISAGANEPVPGSPPLNVSVYSSSAGIPVAILGTLTFPASEFPIINSQGGHRPSFDFSPHHIALEAGQEYFVEFATPFGMQSGTTFNAPFFVGQSPASVAGDHSLSLGRNLSVAPDGHTWIVRPTYGEFGIAVRAVPEPATAAIAAAALAALLAWHRKSALHNPRGIARGGHQPIRQTLGARKVRHCR